MHHVQLDLRVARVFAARIAADHVGQQRLGIGGEALIAAHVDDLLELADRLHVIGVGRQVAARIQLDELIGGGRGVVVLVVLIVGVDRHDDGAARPFRIRMLALDFLEVQNRVGPVLLVEILHAGVVEQLHRTFFVNQMLLLALARAGGQPGYGRRGQQHYDRRFPQKRLNAHGVFLLCGRVAFGLNRPGPTDLEDTSTRASAPRQPNSPAHDERGRRGATLPGLREHRPARHDAVGIRARQ